MFHPVTSALGKRYPTKPYGIHIVFNAVPVLIPVSLDELDQVIDADGFVAAAPAVIAANRYRLAVLDADSNIFSGIASTITVETPECQFLFYREKIEKLEERFFRGRLIHGKKVAAMAFPDLKSKRYESFRIDIYVFELHDDMRFVELLGKVDLLHDLLCGIGAAP